MREIKELCERLGLILRTYQPRDGAIRYEFGVPYGDAGGVWILGTAVGRKMAHAFLEGYELGLERGKGSASAVFAASQSAGSGDPEEKP